MNVSLDSCAYVVFGSVRSIQLFRFYPEGEYLIGKSLRAGLVEQDVK